jgi:hypothetical protein
LVGVWGVVGVLAVGGGLDAAWGQLVIVPGERTQVAVPAGLLTGGGVLGEVVRLVPEEVAIKGNPGPLLWLGVPRAFAVREVAGGKPNAGQAEPGEMIVLSREELTRRLAGSASLRRAVVVAAGEAVRPAVLAGEKVLAEAAAMVVGRIGGDSKRAPWLTAPMLVQRDHPELGWRVRLVLDAAGMGEVQASKAGGPGEPGEPGVVRRAGETLERAELGRLPLLQERERFAYGLGRLARADAKLAAEVAERLLAVLALPSEPLEGLSPARLRAPVFTADAAADGAMVDELAAAADDEQAMGAAKVWLARQPELLAVVTDDSGRLPPGAGVLRRPAMAIINASGRAGVARLGCAGVNSDVMEPLAAFGSLVLRAEPVPASATEVVLRSLGAEQKHAVAGTTVLRPPGLRVERFAQELTAADLLAGRLRLSEPGQATAQIWFDRARGKWLLAITLGAEVGVVRSVEVYGEASAERLASVSKRVIERAAMGEVGDVLYVEVELKVGDEVAAASESGPARRPLPLALVVNREGRGRLSWPRAVFPWQTEPGRTAVDVSNWDGR